MGAKRAIRRGIFRTPAARLFEPTFVIVGTGRSGTGYIAQLLNECGLRVGHEDWWRLDTRSVPGRLRLDGDVSWPATFQLDDYQGTVLHQTRDPIRVMNSHYLDLTTGHRRGKMVRRYRSQWVDLTGDPLTDVMLIYVSWFREAERHAEWTYAVETIDPEILAEVCWTGAGELVSEETTDAAIIRIWGATNQHADQQELTWGDLPDCDLKAEAQDIAAEYGYL